jgi:2-oxoisovalerate dehydrogenase E2 component (dihydrolipoyl transacylase)
MSEVRAFALPDVGEGLTEAEILRWHVRPGDVVKVNQIIVEIETAKASVELPCPFAGTVTELLVAEGSIVPVGSPIITVETPDAPPAAERQAVLVGYGVREGTAEPRRRRRRDAVPADTGTPPTEASRAKPPVRKLARDLGVELSAVTPTGAHGEVTRADVLAAGSGGASGSAPTAPLTTAPGPVAPAASPVASPAAPGERLPVRGVHRAMADAMVQSAFTAPHVTEWVDVDMSRAMDTVARLRALPGASDLRISPMILVAAGLIRAAVRYPMINSTWVDETDGPHVMLHREVNLGIAADTPRGLLVPTIKGASRLGLLDLARAVQALIETARAGRSTPADLTGGTISLTNIGVFGVDGGTPILSPGQTAILAMGRILDRAWVVDGQLVPRPVMQLTLSFDHRVIDGALGSRALRSVAEFLEDPAMALMVDRESPAS